MKNVKVLGIGCANCKRTSELILQVAREHSIEINLEKIEEPAKIASFGIMSTPGVVVDDTIVHAGGVPKRDQIEQWLC